VRLLERTVVWNRRHLMTVLREYEDFCSTRRPHRALNQAAPLRRCPMASPTSIRSGSSGVTALGV
jgi:putative transposase